MARRFNFIVFFTIAFTAYAFLNFYVFLRGWESFAGEQLWREVYAGLYLFLSLSFVVGRFMERAAITRVSDFFVYVGSFWLAAMVYFFLCAAVIDVIRVINHFFPFIPPFINGEAVTLAVIALVFTLISAGYVNARTPIVKELTFDIPKKMNGRKEIIIAAASDIHLGTIICKWRLERIVEKLNAMNADIVLLPGDVIDEDLGPVIKMNLGETLRTIKSKHGVFAVTGNHEYIGGVEEACAYLTEHGIRMLRDEAVKVMGGLYLVGREDLSIRMFDGKRRKELSEIMQGVDTSLPVILMDHQPAHLNDAPENNVDVQLSGHTHHAQLWPFSYITKAVYEVSWGYKKKGNTHSYVSCGVGTWGPPVRIGSVSEVLKIRLKFKE
ncbi:MAG TPA: metallophosphoesterase [Bacteroidota bacterium]|nr:metallophosphoesterase [Bacteroidota bacterium]